MSRLERQSSSLRTTAALLAVGMFATACAENPAPKETTPTLGVPTFDAAPKVPEAALTPNPIEDGSLPQEFDSNSYVLEIDDETAKAMEGVTLRDIPNCATADQLRIIDVPYVDSAGNSTRGRIVMHHLLAEEVGDLFEVIYTTGYRIDKIAPAEEVITDLRSQDPQIGVEIDNRMMSANVTSGFNCRTLDGQPDKHGQGFALDINPRDNPMIIPNPFKTPDAGPFEYSPPEAESIWGGATSIADIEGDPFRTLAMEYVIGNKVVSLFKDNGWRWGGDWNSLYDGQHFDKVVG